MTTLLSARTTLRIGGPARAHATFDSADSLRPHLEAGGPVLLLGGGSNLVVADAGFPGTVLESTDASIVEEPDGDGVLWRVGAAHDWDALVRTAVERGLAGLECLSGIPGRVGAAPIQNIGAYGQEVVETVEAVEALEVATGRVERIPRDACAFGYRTSRFKHAEAGRWVVLAVWFRLRPGPPTLRYAELARRAEEEGAASLAAVRDLVLSIRRGKSMVLDPSDPDARSAGSFFTNPVLPDISQVEAASDGPVPQWPVDGGTKLAAAWLIERAGFHRGWGDGPAGLSSKHTLAIVNRGGATAADVLDVAMRVRRGVRDRFGVTLVPEPVFVGFHSDDPTLVLDAVEHP